MKWSDIVVDSLFNSEYGRQQMDQLKAMNFDLNVAELNWFDDFFAKYLGIP